MKIVLEIISAIVIKNFGSDKCFMHVASFPNPVYPYNGTLTLEFDAAYDTGEKFIKSNFNINPEVIERR